MGINSSEGRVTVSTDKNDIIKTMRQNGVCSSRTKTKFSMFHLSAIALFAFWVGVVFALYGLNSSKVVVVDNDDAVSSGKDSDTEWDYVSNDTFAEDSNRLITRPEKYDDSENLKTKKLILLYGDNIWTKYDKWRRYEWRKCPPKWSNCRITTDISRLSDAEAVIYNGAKMPSSDHVSKVKSDSTLKRIFLSGLTPLRTKFDPADFDDFFDMSITYKNESDIRIPYWPNDGLLPAMYRPKSTYKPVPEEDMLDLQDEIKSYFKKYGKESFMAYTIKNCTPNLYPNLFVGKLREEGLISTFGIHNSSDCLKLIKETESLPCKGFHSDDCVKHFERFKFVIVPDEDLCIDYTTRDYWNAILAWQAVPLLYGASNYKQFLIPNSYIDTVGNEDYISPSFKKAYGPSLDSTAYYKTFNLWRHEDRIEEYHWQCDLCRKLNKVSSSTKAKIEMSKFWDKNENCGSKLKTHELMRLQLVRTGVISG